MIKSLILITYNKINNSNNFFNYLIQINIKIKILKIKNFYKNNIKIIIFNDTYYKINQFLKSLSKCLYLKKIFSYNNFKIIDYKKIFKNNVKFIKNFIFIIYIKKYLLFYNFKKLNYVNSILNFFYKNIIL